MRTTQIDNLAAHASRHFAAAVAVFAAACAAGKTDAYDYGSEGARLYTEMCAVCHGEVGEGGIGPTLMDSPNSKSSLAAMIDPSMPTGDPSRCQGECADLVADFIVNGLTSSALACDSVGPSKRKLRLLTRREYDATVAGIFGQAPGVACASHLECPFDQACETDTCRATGCDEHHFVFDASGRDPASVHVAGSFNDWAATVSDGGYPLSRQSGPGQQALWVGRHSLPMGQSEYKFVVIDGAGNSEWLVDERSPAFVDDGFGGRNSTVRPSCGGSLDSVTSAFPVEGRPEGFAFDNEASAANVTAAHLDAYLGAAETLADRAVSDLEQLVSCDPRLGNCAAAIVDGLGPRIFRRPLTDLERIRYLAVAMTPDDPLAGARDVLVAMLISPHFLYRSELGEEHGKHYRLTGTEIASALSYMFWGTAPDDELLAAAARGELDSSSGIETQARRLLASPRSREMVGLFALQWLGAENISTAVKSEQLGFADELRAEMLAETREFANHVVFDSSGTFSELIEADYTVASSVLADFYGLSRDASGLAAYDGQRSGVLGHGSVLGSFAHSDQTSPIRRGLFVRRRLLCQELPPPPVNAGGVPDVDPNATTRERFAAHTDNPACSGCHQYIDGLGFGFERFDAVGRYRDLENGTPIDSSGELVGLTRLGDTDSISFSTVPELANAVAHSDSARSCFVRQAVRFSRGHRETLEDRCARLALEADFAESGYDIGELLIRIATSPDFVERK